MSFESPVHLQMTVCDSLLLFRLVVESVLVVLGPLTAKPFASFNPRGIVPQ